MSKTVQHMREVGMHIHFERIVYICIQLLLRLFICLSVAPSLAVRRHQSEGHVGLTLLHEGLMPSLRIR